MTQFGILVLLLGSRLLHVAAQNATQVADVIPSNASPLSFAACGPASVDDYGVFTITPDILLGKSTDPSVNASGILFTVYTNNQLVINQNTFTQDNINNPTKANLVQVTPVQLLVKQMASSAQVNLTILMTDPNKNSLSCNMPVTVVYTFAPYLNPSSSLTIATVPGQPVLITSTVFQILEKHQLSSWNLQLAASQITQGSGVLEIYYASSQTWLPVPQFTPYEMIDAGALRYNPLNFVGTLHVTLTVSNSRGFRMTPWLDSQGNPTFNATMQFTSTARTNSTVAFVPVLSPIPPLATTNCKVTFPSRFLGSSLLPLGPYCTNFSTTANIPVTNFALTPPNGPQIQISLTTNINAMVYFGTAVAPTSADYLPAGYTPLRFAGYFDYGSFFLYITPSNVIITSVTGNGQPSITLVTPEISYDQIALGLTLGQISGTFFDPVYKNQATGVFPQSMNTNPGPPQLTMSLSQTEGMFMLLTSSSQTTNSNAQVGYGGVQYLGAYQSRTFLFPVATAGNVSCRIVSQSDLQVTVLNKCATTWVPGGAGKLDCFNVTVVSQSSSASISVNVTLSYNWMLPLNTEFNSLPTSTITWTHFVNSLDGGNWLASDSILDLANSMVTTSFLVTSTSQNMLGQWGVYELPPNAGVRTMRWSLALVVLIGFLM
ncbi:hypothetical protein HDU98_006110 [Podochytrium sp. JEL0797]|nr:hypothetical protein HDU98_006110 [Podochytrium sp. JEL0797]